MQQVFVPFVTMVVLGLSLIHGGCQKSEQSREKDGADQADLDVKEDSASQGRERIFYTDNSTFQSVIYDMQDRKVVLTLPYEGLARVYSGALGRYGYLVEAEYDRITIVDSGLSLKQEAGEWTEQVDKPTILESKVTGLAPTHFVAHDSRVAIFFDNEGKAKVLDEQSLVTPIIQFN
jgi:hypothetical protein